MPTQIIVVPTEVWMALGGKGLKRVIATMRGQTLRLGLLPLEGGGRYLMLNKELCRAVGLEMGKEVDVELAVDPNPDHVDLPQELAEALAAWPEAEIAFNNYSGSHRRAMAYRIAEAKQPETRIRRAVTLVERLGRGLHPFRND